MSTVTPQSEPKLDRDALAAMYEETFRNFEEGTITEGMVVAIGKDKVVVDIGYKSEGMIPADQFSHEELAQLKVGDRPVSYTHLDVYKRQWRRRARWPGSSIKKGSWSLRRGR